MVNFCLSLKPTIWKEISCKDLVHCKASKECVLYKIFYDKANIFIKGLLEEVSFQRSLYRLYNDKNVNTCEFDAIIIASNFLWNRIICFLSCNVYVNVNWYEISLKKNQVDFVRLYLKNFMEGGGGSERYFTKYTEHSAL